jgi:hypothetical protein
MPHSGTWRNFFMRKGIWSMSTVTSVSRGTKPTDTTPVAAASRLPASFHW